MDMTNGLYKLYVKTEKILSNEIYSYTEQDFQY